MSNLFPLIGVSGADLFKNSNSNSFASASSQRLSISDANFGAYTLAKWAVSAWWKRASAGASHTIISHQGAPGNVAWTLNLNAANQLVFASSADGTATDALMAPNDTYADTASWHHVLLYFDSANGTPNDRCRMWVDGAEITSFASGVRPTAAVFNSTAVIAIGMRNSAFYFNGLLDEVAFFDNALPSISDLVTGTPGSPKPLRSLTGLKSWVRSDNGITTDEILATAWTNTNGVTQSTDAP